MLFVFSLFINDSLFNLPVCNGLYLYNFRRLCADFLSKPKNRFLLFQKRIMLFGSCSFLLIYKRFCHFESCILPICKYNFVSAFLRILAVCKVGLHYIRWKSRWIMWITFENNGFSTVFRKGFFFTDFFSAFSAANSFFCLRPVFFAGIA